MFLGWITFIKQKLLWPHKILVWNKSKDLVEKFLRTLTWLYISLEIPTIKKHPVCQSFESFLLKVILRPWPSEFFIPDPVFAARTEIKVWQDYHLRKLLTQISISRGCKQLISSYIKLHVVEKSFHSCWPWLKRAFLDQAAHVFDLQCQMMSQTRTYSMPNLAFW